MKFEDFDFDNILKDEQLHENISICDISYKTLIAPKPLRIRFDKIDGFIRIYDGTIYLVLFGPEKYDALCLISLKGRITYVVSHYYKKIEIGSYDSLPIEKTLTRHNVIVLIQSRPNKDQSHYYYNMFLKKYSSQLAK